MLCVTVHTCVPDCKSVLKTFRSIQFSCLSAAARVKQKLEPEGRSTCKSNFLPSLSHSSIHTLMESQLEADAFKRIYPEEYFQRFLSEGTRPDGRPLGRARSTIIGFGAVSTADGSALVKIGSTVSFQTTAHCSSSFDCRLCFFQRTSRGEAFSGFD
jgi:polyribonucleotide nucleotidyltransferase